MVATFSFAFSPVCSCFGLSWMRRNVETTATTITPATRMSRPRCSVATCQTSAAASPTSAPRENVSTIVPNMRPRVSSSTGRARRDERSMSQIAIGTVVARMYARSFGSP